MDQRRSHPLGVPSASGHGPLSSGGPPGGATGYGPPPVTGRVTALDRWLVRRVAAAMGHPPLAFTLWDGEDVWRPEGELRGRIKFLHRRALIAVIHYPELGFGDHYSAGGVEIEGDLLDVLYQGYTAIDRASVIGFKRSIVGLLPRPRPNSTLDSRQNIHHHYDLGNDFYRLWLDANMVYTCAYYRSPDASLEEAQIAKMDHVCRKVGLEPGMSVVEAGCGWGSLALHMARHFGVRVRAFNISREQVAYARERAVAEGLEGHVEFVEDDYRNITGRYDAFVSVGMLEHVGRDNYRALGDVVHRVLHPHGRALVHSVGRSVASPVNAWLERRIFPGSYPPSLREMMDILEPHRFSVLDIENLRLHYARTLTEWLARFDGQVDTIRHMYDNAFVRAWRLYLAGCAAAFRSSSIQLFQVVFTHPSNNRIPMTRAGLYRDDRSPVWNVSD